jgi:hypothetical protein
VREVEGSRSKGSERGLYSCSRSSVMVSVEEAERGSGSGAGEEEA